MPLIVGRQLADSVRANCSAPALSKQWGSVMTLVIKPKPLPWSQNSNEAGQETASPAPSSGANPAELTKPTDAASKPDKAASMAKAKTVKKPTVKREQSSIAFPYMDLDAAVTVARAFITNGGGALTRDQLAGVMNQSPLSGAFIMKLSAARQFGLADFVEGKFKLTDLGFLIVDKNEAREKAARFRRF